MSFVYERAVHFEEVDAAGIVFFSRFLTYAHEAMDALLGGLEGGYVRLVNERRIGLPAVHLECDFRAPLRFGDVARIETRVARIGGKSVTFRHEFFRKGTGDPIATIEHVCAVTDLDAMRALPVPDDVRALLEKHST
jgi:4-hydroxybenzoyl-CoA thioesterase